MNDALVATNGDIYHYRSYLTMLLSYGCNAKETWLKHLEGWGTDEDGKYDAQETLVSSAGSHLFDVKGRLYSDMLLQEQLVPNKMNVWLVLSCSRPVFHLMAFGVKPKAHVHIEEAILEIS